MAPSLLHSHSFHVKLAWKYLWGRVAVRKTLQQANLARLYLSLITNMRGVLLNFFIGNGIWNIFYLAMLTQIMVLAPLTLSLSPTHLHAC